MYLTLTASYVAIFATHSYCATHNIAFSFLWILYALSQHFHTYNLAVIIRLPKAQDNTTYLVSTTFTDSDNAAIKLLFLTSAKTDMVPFHLGAINKDFNKSPLRTVQLCGKILGYN